MYFQVKKPIFTVSFLISFQYTKSPKTRHKHPKQIRKYHKAKKPAQQAQRKARLRKQNLIYSSKQ